MLRQIARKNGKVLRRDGKVSCDCSCGKPCNDLTYPVDIVSQPSLTLSVVGSCSHCDSGSLAATLPFDSGIDDPGDEFFLQWRTTTGGTCAIPSEAKLFEHITLGLNCIEIGSLWKVSLIYRDSPFSFPGHQLRNWDADDEPNQTFFGDVELDTNSDGDLVGSIRNIRMFDNAGTEICTVEATLGP